MTRPSGNSPIGKISKLPAAQEVETLWRRTTETFPVEADRPKPVYATVVKNVVSVGLCSRQAAQRMTEVD